MVQEDTCLTCLTILGRSGQRTPCQTEFTAIGIDMPQQIVGTAVADHVIPGVSGDAFGGGIPVGDAFIDINEINTVKQAVQQFITGYLLHEYNLLSVGI